MQGLLFSKPSRINFDTRLRNLMMKKSNNQVIVLSKRCSKSSVELFSRKIHNWIEKLIHHTCYLELVFVIVTFYLSQDFLKAITAVIWLNYCRYGVKH